MEEINAMFAGSIEEYGRVCRAEGIAEGAEAVRRMVTNRLVERFGEVPE